MSDAFWTALFAFLGIVFVAWQNHRAARAIDVIHKDVNSTAAAVREAARLAAIEHTETAVKMATLKAREEMRKDQALALFEAQEQARKSQPPPAAPS